MMIDKVTTETPLKNKKIKMHTQSLSKSYGAVTALHPTDINVYDGEILTLLGPSGSGKTTLLQIISGLTAPTSGELFINGEVKTHTPPHLRDIGVVFQNYALFPQMSVYENIAFPLQMRRLSASDIKKKVSHVLEMVGLGAHSNRFPHEMSGGQQQRVALARSLVYQPSLLLMDESLSALDRKLRESIQLEIKKIHRETGTTIIFVTHDQEEALALSDRVCLMNSGRIEQTDTPENIYENPTSLFSADFIGISNRLDGIIESDGFLQTAEGKLPIPSAVSGISSGSPAALIIRPEYIHRINSSGLLSARVTDIIYAGSENRLIVTLNKGTVLTLRQPAGIALPQTGEIINLHWETSDSRLLTH